MFPREALVSDLRLAAADVLGIDSADDGATGEASVGPVILARVATLVTIDVISLRHLPTPLQARFVKLSCGSTDLWRDDTGLRSLLLMAKSGRAAVSQGGAWLEKNSGFAVVCFFFWEILVAVLFEAWRRSLRLNTYVQPSQSSRFCRRRRCGRPGAGGDCQRPS